MNRRTNEIGFSQRVRLEWLEQVANLVLAGNDKSAVNDALQALLKDKVSVGGQAIRGNREKIITILMKVWLNAPPELDSLRMRRLGTAQAPSSNRPPRCPLGDGYGGLPFLGPRGQSSRPPFETSRLCGGSTRPAPDERAIRGTGNRIESSPPDTAFFSGLGSSQGH